MNNFFLKAILLSGLFSVCHLFSASLMLENDSPYVLTAVIQGNNGMELGQITLNPGVTKIWSRDLSSIKSNHTFTPFVVLWKCPNEGYFSISNGLGAGALASANSGTGSMDCRPKPKDEKKEK